MSLALRKQRKHKDDSGKQNNETWRTLSAFPLTSSPESSWMSFQKWAISCYDTQGMAVCDRDISWKNRPLLSTSAGSAIFWCGWSIRGGGYIPSEMGSRLSTTFLQTWEGGQQLGYLEGFYMGAFWARPRLSTVQSTLKWRHTGALCCKKKYSGRTGTGKRCLCSSLCLAEAATKTSSSQAVLCTSRLMGTSAQTLDGVTSSLWCSTFLSKCKVEMVLAPLIPNCSLLKKYLLWYRDLLQRIRARGG